MEKLNEVLSIVKERKAAALQAGVVVDCGPEPAEEGLRDEITVAIEGRDTAQQDPGTDAQ